MTQLAAAMVCLLAGTLVSTRRGSATSAAKGANIGAASILCEAALQADEISAQAKALPCDAVKKKIEVTLNSVPAEVWAHLLKHSGRLGKQTLALVGNGTASGTLDKFCARAGQGTDTRVCSAKNELATCTKKATEAQEEVTEAVAPAHATKATKWNQTGERQSREAANAKNLCLGATMVYLCTGEANSNPCFSKGEETGQLTGGNAASDQGDAGGHRNLAESKDRPVQGKNSGQKYQEHNRTLLGTGTRQEDWGRQGPTIGRVRRLWRDQK
ncbi:hypothetical protein ERJ75_001160100 [Trypanosoma vivax]|nr:hypothetical protein ERJ75_001160100 [Trypanosoma vivax]